MVTMLLETVCSKEYHLIPLYQLQTLFIVEIDHKVIMHCKCDGRGSGHGLLNGTIPERLKQRHCHVRYTNRGASDWSPL